MLYRQGHFGLGPPLGFQEGNELATAWMRDDFPRMLVVTLQHPAPYFDDSYAVNSVNVGPYGDALMQELIPEVEKRFRAIGEPWARITDGGSTGGWISLAHQIFYPDFYGGVWSYCPDSVTFTDVEGINIYTDDHDEPALQGVLPLRRRQGALLARTRIDGRTTQADGRSHRRAEARGHDDAVVEILTS